MKTAHDVKTITNNSETNIQTYSFPDEIIGALAERFQKLGYEVENLNGNTMLGIYWKS